MSIIIQHQNFMLAVRQLMGWPTFKPANDAIAFSSGRQVDFEVGAELARFAQTLRKDLIYTAWESTTAKDPISFCVAYRELLTVDIVDRLVPFAESDDTPLILVSTRADEFFAVDRRGSLARETGKPKNIGKGRKLAFKRIKAAAASRCDVLLPNNLFVENGADVVEQDAPIQTVVRFN